MQLIIRNEEPGDYREVDNLTREAFWNLHVPGCNEHYLAHLLRKSPAFIPELDFVAVNEGIILGNIMYAKSLLISDDGVQHPVITFGPVSVLPEHQGKGIGAALIRHSLAKAKEMGFGLVFIYGDPTYYSRFGFREGEAHNIRTKDGLYTPALQVLQLADTAIIPGRFVEDSVYEVDDTEAEEFDKGFPKKEKEVTASQQKFLDMLAQTHP